MKKGLKSLIILFAVIITANKAMSSSLFPELKPYNEQPEAPKINLLNIRSQKDITGNVVISPDMSKVAYSEVFYYPSSNQTASRVLVFSLKKHLTKITPDDISKIMELKNNQQSNKVIIETGLTEVKPQYFQTLSIIDWSKDSSKLLVKESYGENGKEIEASYIWVYDFNTQQAKRLDNIRYAISRYWKNNMNIDLSEYAWDIAPLGFDEDFPDQIILNSYGFTADKKAFLGCWSLSVDGSRTELVSLDDKPQFVGKYGYAITK